MRALIVGGLLFVSLTAHAENSPRATGRCLLIDANAPERVTASKPYDLGEGRNAENIGTVGTATYTIRLQVIPAHYKSPAKAYLELILQDPSRNLQVKAIRPAGATYADDLQLEAPYGLPHALSYPET